MHSTANVVIISRRYRGPPESANGGYACGVVARHLTGNARVRLHRPPPLDQSLSIVLSAGRAEMTRGDQLIAEGIAAEVTAAVPAPVGFDEAVDATSRYRWVTGHPFPGCFVCGPERHAGDGLCIFPGCVTNRNVVAAPWIPHPSVCDPAGLAHLEVVWAALDCPSWFGALEFESGTAGALLGQLTARVVRRPRANERCVAIGWSRGRDGRKLYAGAALFGGDGSILGSSEAIWIEPKQ